ncbi:Sodium:sulfate symporter transmembrane region family protein [Tritrichomonas foetus]|uniref:Sodium:sulfate symporter transmembrane region family protein n=1 Tax=Tritrichomonas foetus TaxID=1144522 RepID=A0A1J4KH04_9EUKA|nr:Sodium:sulfate symporter transmembrane region family protein [Tritrichomonas foetus]|eukprot:OHT10703.1 Sodium:sulfate symporter transmembrane region family protein [Tritrichomonas foetus]
MKFGRQIRFVAAKQWYDHYIPYNELKGTIKQLLFRIQETCEITANDNEIINVRKECIESFQNTVINHINRIIAFYIDTYLELETKINAITMDIEDFLETKERSDEADKSFHTRIYSLMFEIYELRTFLEVNKTGSQKIMKKFAKHVEERNLYQEFLETQREYFDNLPAVNKLMRELEDLFVMVKRNISAEKIDKSRPEIVVELHASIESALIWKQSTVLAKFEAMTFRHNELLLAPVKMKIIPIIVAVILLLACQFVQFTSKFDFKAQRCLGIVAFAAVMWASGAVPLWLTSLSVPLFGIICDVLPGHDYETVGKLMQQAMMSPTIFLTIGGFTIAAALRETEMDKRLATVVLQKASVNRRFFLLVLIILNAFIAMWISNITSTTIVVTLVIPTLKQIPTGSDYAKAVLFAIAVGGNLGGMMTPLSSPQNAVTVESVATAAKNAGIDVSISFTEFFATALPYSLFCCIACWGVLQLRFKMDISSVPPVPAAKTDFGWRQILVSVVSVLTVGIWISLPFGGNRVFSDFGMVGFLPLLIFYGSTILPPSRIADLPWNIIFLLMGGNALSKIVTDSGLMKVANDLMAKLLGGTSLWVTILIVNICVLVIDFFLTHTVSSMITLPLVCGFAATSGHLGLYAMAACMTTTASQILPVSSFPNMCTISLQDANNKNYLIPSEMIKWGLMVTAVCFVSVMSVYFGIGLAYGL